MSDNPIWDIHTHGMPEWLVSEMRADNAWGVRIEQRDGQDWVVHPEGANYPLNPGQHDLDARLAEMDAVGTDVGVVSLSPTMNMLDLPADEAREYARRVNDGFRDLVEASSGRLRALAHLPLQDPDAIAAEVDRAVGELGLVGCQANPVIGDHFLDEERFAPMLERIAHHRVPLSLHPYMVGVGDRAGLDRYYLTNLVGHPYQTALGASRMIMGGVFDRYPDLEIVLMHGGGYLPYQVGRLDHGYDVRPESRCCAQTPSTYLDRITFDTLTHSDESLRFLVDRVGADHVAYGTDFPYDMGGGSFVDQTSGADLTPSEAELIQGANGRRLYERTT